MAKYILILISALLFSRSSLAQNAKGESDNKQIKRVELRLLQTVTKYNQESPFSFITNIVIDNAGKIYAVDYKRSKVHVFDSTATYITTFGRKGRGPGEFITIRMFLIEENLLGIMDVSQARITVYELNKSAYEHSKIIDAPRWPIGHFDVGKNLSHRKVKSVGDAYYSLFESTFSTTKEEPNVINCFLKLDKQFKPILSAGYLCYERLKLLMHETNSEGVQTVNAMTIPGGFQRLMVLDRNGNLIYCDNSKAEIVIQNLATKNKRTIAFDAVTIERTSDEKYQLVQESMNGDSPFSRREVYNAIPDYYPHATQLLVDADQHIWVLARASKDKMRWLIYDYSGNQVGMAAHPGGSFKQIKDNMAVSLNDISVEEPGFRVYALEWD